jgi:hypothetical protein
MLHFMKNINHKFSYHCNRFHRIWPFHGNCQNYNNHYVLLKYKISFIIASKTFLSVLESRSRKKREMNERDVWKANVLMSNYFKSFQISPSFHFHISKHWANDDDDIWKLQTTRKYDWIFVFIQLKVFRTLSLRRSEK